MSYQAVPIAPAEAKNTATQIITVASAPFQTDWLGLNANYSALPGYGLTAQNKTDDYDRVATSGVKIVSTWYDTGWSYASYPSGSPDWSSANMTEFYAYLSGMQSRGVSVFIKMGWHFPQNIAASSGAAPATPTPSNETTFCSWVSESLNQFINVRGYTNVIGIQLFTEPSTNQMGTIPGGYSQPYEYYAHIATIVRAKIASDDASRTPILPRIKVIGPDNNSFTTNDWSLYLKNTIPGTLDAYADHSYCVTPAFAPLGLGASSCAPYQSWLDRFTLWTSGVSPTALYADEGGFTVGGDSDSTGYRATADCGWQWARLIEGHMEAGCGSSLIWLLADQPILGDVVTGPTLFYGTMSYIKTANTTKPSWFAISMLANLMGGGGGTKLYACTTGTNQFLHAVAAYVPYGVRGAVNTAGEWTLLVINENTTPVTVQGLFTTPIDASGRTFYRYTYSGEIPTLTTATLLPWDRRFTGVKDGIPPNVLPARSVVCFSTIAMATPTGGDNVALTASATSDSTGLGVPANVIDGNFSNVQGSYNGWKKSDNSSHYLELTWTSSVSIARIKLAFVATTAGQVYATYTDTSTPAPVADYTVQYWNGSAFTDFSTPINVTGNASPNKEHTFNSVSTTKIRLTVTSVAATSQVNQLAAYAS